MVEDGPGCEGAERTSCAQTGTGRRKYRTKTGSAPSSCDIGRRHCFNTPVPCPRAEESVPGHGDCRRDQYSATATRDERCSRRWPSDGVHHPTSLDMADTTEVAVKVAPVPSREQLERVEKFTREPFAPDADALRPGTARRRALDMALAEIEAGLESPSVEWRQQYSMLLGLERLLADEEPKLVDGTVLSAHQVDALSGTLTALIAEAERQNGNGAVPLELEDFEEEEPDEEEPTRRSPTRTRRTRSPPTGSIPRRARTASPRSPRKRSSSPSSPRTRARPAASGSSTRRARARPWRHSASSRHRAPAAR